MKRFIRKFKIVGNTAYLEDGSVMPFDISVAPAHGNTQHTSTFVTQTDIDNSITTHEGENHLYEILDYDADATLDASSFRKIHRMDVSGGYRRFYLPDISTGYQGEWMIFVRKGTANTLEIGPVGTDVIFNSDIGAAGALECSDASHNYSSMLLIVMDDGVWGNPTFGIWSTR